ncbi:ABC transporter ATP-binding protein/permease, partial [Pseudomonas syringae pv. maculicola]
MDAQHARRDRCRLCGSDSSGTQAGSFFMISLVSRRQRQAIRLAASFIAPYRWQALGALLALVVTAGITLSIGQGIKLMIDQGFMTRSP